MHASLIHFQAPQKPPEPAVNTLGRAVFRADGVQLFGLDAEIELKVFAHIFIMTFIFRVFSHTITTEFEAAY